MKFANQKGYSLIEVVITIALLATIGTAIFRGLGTGVKTLMITNEIETAKNIAEMQLEYIKSLPYSSSYLPRDISSDYPGFYIVTHEDGFLHTEAVPDRLDGNIQKIELTVIHGSKNILTVSGYKVR